MSKQERRRVRVAASLGLTVLMSSAILGGMAPLTAHAAEVGSEPTTAEVSPLITAPEDPSDTVVGLPEGDSDSVEVVAETLGPAEEAKEEEAKEEEAALDPDPEKKADDELPTQSENIEESGQTTAQPASPAESTDASLPDETEVLDGDWGDVHWTFKDGLLSLAGGTGEDTGGISPWALIASQVTKVEITGQIIAPSSIYGLFADFSAVTAFDGLANIDTSNVTLMWDTFKGTSSLEHIDLSSWDVKNVTDMDSMFMGSGLVSLDLSTWLPAGDTYLANIFSAMPQLKFLNISSWSRPDKMNLFGGDALNLKTIVLGAETRVTGLNAGPDFMWRGENTGVTFHSNYTGGNADTYHRVPVESDGKWGTVTWMIDNNTLYLSGGEGAATFGDAPWASLESTIHAVVIEDTIIAPEKMGSLFANLSEVTSYDGLEKLNVSKTTDMSHLFENNSRVTALDLSNWDTSNVTDMSYLFYNTASVTFHDLANWDTGNVRNMNAMFAHNFNVNALDLATWDTANVTDMSSMFAYNPSLTGLDLSNWDTSNLTTINSMFYYCSDLTELGIESWKVGALEDISYFLERTKLETLDLSNWKFSGRSAFRAFAAMSKLQTIDISGFDLRGANTFQMLTGMPNLEAITLGEKSTFAWSLDEVAGQVWSGDVTGHQFSQVYNGGYPDTYRLAEGTLVHHTLRLLDSQKGYELGEGILYGQPGEIVSLSRLKLPAGYELPDADATIQLPEGEETWTYDELHLNRVVTTTTRTIQFKGLPAGHLKDEVQEIKWHWGWLEEDMEPLNRNLRFYEGVVYMPQGGYAEFQVREIEGYKADVQVVAAQTFDAEHSELPEDETVTVTYTKLDSGDGGDQNPDPIPSQPDTDHGGGSGGSTGTGSTGTGSIGGGQLTNLSTGGSTTTNSNQALPQTGSQVASGLTLFGLGLLGLLGFTKRRKRD